MSCKSVSDSERYVNFVLVASLVIPHVLVRVVATMTRTNLPLVFHYLGALNVLILFCSNCTLKCYPDLRVVWTPM